MILKINSTRGHTGSLLVSYSDIPNSRTYIRLFIFRNIAVLYGLIRVYTFIRFVSNPPYTIFIWSMFITLNII